MTRLAGRHMSRAEVKGQLFDLIRLCRAEPDLPGYYGNEPGISYHLALLWERGPRDLPGVEIIPFPVSRKASERPVRQRRRPSQGLRLDTAA